MFFLKGAHIVFTSTLSRLRRLSEPKMYTQDTNPSISFHKFKQELPLYFLNCFFLNNVLQFFLRLALISQKLEILIDSSTWHQRAKSWNLESNEQNVKIL